MRGLLRITNVGSVFVPSGCILKWLFKTPSLASFIGKSWVSLFLLCGIPAQRSVLGSASGMVKGSSKEGRRAPRCSEEELTFAGVPAG